MLVPQPYVWWSIIVLFCLGGFIPLLSAALKPNWKTCH